MKQFFTLVAAIITITAQAQQIKGQIKDSDGNPVPSATVSLMRAADSSVVKFSISSDNGAYSFSGIRPGAYRINVSHVSFSPAFSAPFTLADADVTVSTIQLAKTQGSMGNVVVTARKPLVEVRADKMILNVEGTINATGNDALELLRKSPGVSVDKDDNLSLAGKNGVQVYIDNRPTPLAGQDLANYLKALESSQIEAIEIITNPSAKYDAAGNAGIINIRLKKNKAFGTNGSATAGWQVGENARYNGSLNLNHRNKNVNLYGTYSHSNGVMTQQMNGYRSILDTAFDGKTSVVVKPIAHNFKAGIDYTINKKSSIGAIVNGLVVSPEIVTTSNTIISNVSTGNVVKLLEAGGTSKWKRNNYNLNLNYNYTAADGKSLVVNADKGYFDIDNDQYQPNIYYDASGRNKLSSVIYQINSPTKIGIHSVKADYEQNFAKGKLGFGGKTAFIKTDNDFRRYNVYSTGNELDRDRSNRFTYNENINAAYVNYNRPFKGFMLQLGLRAENTITEGTSNAQKKNGSSYEDTTYGFDRNYLDVFPSAAISFNKNPMNQWSISYSRRIDRPAYQDLNPFEFKVDEYTAMKGNTDLRPQYTNSFSVSNTYKYKLTTSLSYSHVANLFTQIIDTVERSKAFITKKNLATQDITALNISYPWMYKSLTVFANVNANYSMYKANFGAGRTIDVNAFGLTAMTQSSYKFGKAKTWTAELTGFFNAPTVYQGTFKTRSIWSVEPGVQKQVLGGKGNIKASVADVFKTMRFKGTSDFAGQTVKFNGMGDTRMLKLNFTYRFGSATVKAARQRTTGVEDELKRAQQDGGMGPVRQ